MVATRSTNISAPSSPITSAAPMYTTAVSAAAHKNLCGVYTLTARAVQIGTNGDNPALSGIAVVNGALMLEHVVGANPALPPAIETPHWHSRTLIAILRRSPPRCSNVMIRYGSRPSVTSTTNML